MKNFNLAKILGTVLIAIAVTGCTGYTIHDTVEFEGLVYPKTAELQLNKCLKDLVNTNSTVRVKVVTSYVETQNIDKITKVSRQDFVEFCMTSNGILKK